MEAALGSYVEQLAGNGFACNHGCTFFSQAIYMLAAVVQEPWEGGCDGALFSEKKGFPAKRGEAIQ